MVTPSPDSAVSWREVFAAGLGPRLALLCFGIWLHATDGTLVATLLPVAVDDIGGARILSWAVALYELGTITAGAVTGLLVMRIGLARVQVFGALAFAIGCAISALAPSMETLVAGRLLQGIGGGTMIAIAFVGVLALFPERFSPRLWAVISTVWGSASLCGPLIGGWFADAETWRLAFWVFAAQATILAVLAPLVLVKGKTVPQKPSTRPEPVPWLRLLLLAASVLMMSRAGTETTIGATLGLIAASIIGLGIVFLWDRVARDRLFPRNLLDWRQASGTGLTAMFLLSTATVAFTTYGPFLMYHLHQAPPLVTGYILALGSVGWSITAVICSGAKRQHEALFIRLGPSLILLTTLGMMVALPRGPLAVIAVLSLLQGAGFGICWVHIMRRVVSSVPPIETAKISSSIPFLQRLGYALGAAMSGVIANQLGVVDSTNNVPEGAGVTWLYAAFVPLALAGAAAAWRLARPAMAGNRKKILS